MVRKKQKKNGKPPSNSIQGESSKEQVPKLLEPKNKKLKTSILEKTLKSENGEGASQSQVTGKNRAAGEGKDKTSDGVGKESNLNASDSGNVSHSLKMKNKNKKKDEIQEKHQETKIDRLPNSEKEVAGVIFMCNTETRPDCFRYHVMAESAAKKEVVLGIKPGVKLFLFDFGLRLLYGVYEATSPGAMNIERGAFGGKFPAQVRFRINEDCSPLPESVFKKAIKENYDEKTNKFQIELTSQQVNKLKKLFRPTHHPQKDLPALLQPALPQPLSSSDSLFVTEEEYRRFGLRPIFQSSRPDAVSYPPVPATSGSTQQGPQVFMAPAPIYRAPVPTYREMPREQIVGGPALSYGNSSSLRDQAVRSDPVFLSEDEYRLYGLRGRPKPISEQSVARSKEDEHRLYGLRGRPEPISEQPVARSKEDEHRMYGLRGRPEPTSDEQLIARSKEDEHRMYSLRGRPEPISDEQLIARSKEDEHRLYGLRGRPEQTSEQSVARSKEGEYRMYALGSQIESSSQIPIARFRENEDRLYGLRGQNDPSAGKLIAPSGVARSSEDDYRLYGLRGQAESSFKNPIVRSGEDEYRLLGLKGQTGTSSEKLSARYSEDEYRLYGLRGRMEPSSQKHIAYSSEDEYRLYGLRDQTERSSEKLLARAPEMDYPENRYLPSKIHETTSDPYLRLPSAVAATYEVYSQPTVPPLRPTDFSLVSHSIDYALPRTANNEGRYSSYGSHELSDYNPRDRRGVGPAPVSSRYAFEGASYSYR